MDFWEVVKKRRCIRSFQDKEIPEGLLGRILQAAVLAPSEGNLQPWYFVIVKDASLKSKLQEAAFGQGQVGQAPIVIVVCVDLEIAQSKYGERGLNLYSLQSTAAATENMFLAATDLGLGACWIGAFSEEKVREVLVLEDKLRPVVLFSLGYPAEKGRFWGRRKLEEISQWK